MIWVVLLTAFSSKLASLLSFPARRFYELMLGICPPGSPSPFVLRSWESHWCASTKRTRVWVLGIYSSREDKVELKAQCFEKSVLRDFPEVTLQNLVCPVYAVISLCQVVLEHCITSCDCSHVAHTNCWKEKALILQDLITRQCYVLVGVHALTWDTFFSAILELSLCPVEYAALDNVCWSYCTLQVLKFSPSIIRIS